MAISRRAFVGGSALALGASAVGLPAIAGAAPADVSSEDAAAAVATPVLVRIVNAESGELEALVGEKAVPFTDKNLVRTLARISKEA